MAFKLTRSVAGLALLAALTAACASSHPAGGQPKPTATMSSPAAPSSPAQPSTSAPPSPAPAQSATANPIPQNNGGDRDADNNGGPSDGDGNI